MITSFCLFAMSWDSRQGLFRVDSWSLHPESSPVQEQLYPVSNPTEVHGIAHVSKDTHAYVCRAGATPFYRDVVILNWTQSFAVANSCRSTTEKNKLHEQLLK